MRNHKNKIIAGVITACILTAVFWWGGSAPSLRGRSPQNADSTNIGETQTETLSLPKQLETEIPAKAAKYPVAKGSIPQNTDETPVTPKKRTAEKTSPGESGEHAKTDEYQTEPVPAEPQDAVISDKEFTCTLSVRCDTILKNILWLDGEKLDLVPKDGVIFAEKTVTFYEGESVFNLLVREMKRNKIHLEFENTPLYNSAYIEGIGNIYEFDCGDLSGWMYKVNDRFPSYGCSRYQLKEDDKVEWVYTCDLGADIGGHYSAGNGLQAKET